MPISRLSAGTPRERGATQPRARQAAAPEPGVVGTFPGMPFGLGIWEILILAGVLVLLFGSKGAPAMARRLGTGVREMKDAVSEMDPRTVFDDKDESPKSKPLPALEAAKPVAADPVAVQPEAVQPEAVPAAAEAVAAPPSEPASETAVAAESEPPAS